MSNIVTLKRTKFSDIYSTDVSFGFRMYDNYDKAYNNFYHIESEGPNEYGLPLLPTDDLELLRVVKQDCCEEAIEGFFDYINYPAASSGVCPSPITGGTTRAVDR